MILKRIIFFLLLLLILAAMGGAALLFYLKDFYHSPGALTETATVRIHSGEGSKIIAYRLAGENVISQPELFYLLLRLTGEDRRLQAGEYAFEPAISPSQVVRKLISGDVIVHHLTFPEGWMTSQIVALIDSQPLLTGAMPENIGEGELLPETYDIRWGESKASVVTRMRDAMASSLQKAWENRAQDTPLNSPEEVLVLASIIEKETAIPAERTRIAGVFTNRLRKQMRLQTDPSVIYAITGGKYVLERPLTKKDLLLDSPYNTYLYAGLPPAPIANPGKASIEAALNPAVTKDLYFVADGTGGHAFSETLEGHLQNVRKWRKFQKQQK